MSIKTKYNFKGILIPEVTIRVIRIFGSSKEGFNSLVGVYITTKETVPAVEAVSQIGFPGEANYVAEVKAVEAHEVTKEELIEDFTFQVPFNVDERGYETVYKALMAKYGGEQV